MDLRGLDLHQRDHAAALALLDLHHPREERVAGVDQVVAEEHREGLVADVRGGAQHRVAETARGALAHVVHGGEVTGLLDLGEALVVALPDQSFLQLVVPVEVVLEGTLVATGDHQNVRKTGRDGLLDDVLDRRFVDDRQHLLRRRLGRRKEAGAEARGRDDSLADPAEPGERLIHELHLSRSE